MTDNQRYALMVIATVLTLIAIGVVNLTSSLATRADTRVVTEIVSVCANDPHSEACQHVALPKVFSEATREELKRYQRSIEARQEELK